jgi:hypoxanthine-DNA glycosylase
VLHGSFAIFFIISARGGGVSVQNLSMSRTALSAAPLPASSPSAGVAAGRGTRWQGLAPVVSAQTVVLVLGSFPGLASLRAGQYYGHPQNQFWKIMAALWPQHPLPPVADYAARCDWLLARRLGLWDVYASCEREGSLDAKIRHAQLNDFAALSARCPQLAVLAHNGGESYRHARAVLASVQAVPHAPPPSLQQALPLDGADSLPRTALGAVPVRAPLDAVRLPSTSPAHAAWSFERKLAAWTALMSSTGLLESTE